MTNAPIPYDPDAGQSPYQLGGIPSAPVGTSPNTPHIWAIVGLFLLQILTSLIYVATIDWSGYMNATMQSATSSSLSGYGAMFGYILTPAYFAILIVGFLVYAATVLLAFFDVKALQARGVQRPFHWALAFIPSYGSMVYVIGRSVVVRRRTGSGLVPMWTYIIVFVLSIVVSLVVTFGAIANMMNQIPYYSTY